MRITKNLRHITLIFSAILLSLLGINHASAQSWDLTSDEGQLELILSVMNQDPQFQMRNASFQTDHFKQLERAGKILEDLRELQENSEAPEGESVGSEEGPLLSILTALGVGANGEITYNQDLIDKLITQLIGDLTGITDAYENFPTFEDFVENVPNDKTTKKWVRLIPFLYSSDGNRIDISPEDLREKLSNLTMQQIQGAYRDQFLGHQLPIIRSLIEEKERKVISQHFDSVTNNFIKKELQRAESSRQIVTDNSDPSKIANLKIEEVPPEVGLFRGCYGGDCSNKGVTYYSLVPGVKVYFIYKSKTQSFEGPPLGYAFALPVEVEGDDGVKKTIPYILTVNGKLLDAVDVKASVKAIAADWGVSSYLYASKDIHGIVNDEQKRIGLSDSSGVLGNSIVDFSTVEPFWKKLKESATRHGVNETYFKYYDFDKISRGTRYVQSLPEPDFELNREQKPTRYKSVDTSKMSPLELAVALAPLGKSKAMEHSEKFELSEEQVTAGIAIHSANTLPLAYLNDEEFQLAKEFLDFKIEDILKLNLSAATISLSVLRRTNDAITSNENWIELEERLHAKLINRAQQFRNQGEIFKWIEYLSLSLVIGSKNPTAEVLKELTNFPYEELSAEQLNALFYIQSQAAHETPGYLIDRAFELFESEDANQDFIVTYLNSIELQSPEHWEGLTMLLIQAKSSETIDNLGLVFKNHLVEKMADQDPNNDPILNYRAFVQLSIFFKQNNNITEEFAEDIKSIILKGIQIPLQSYIGTIQGLASNKASDRTWAEIILSSPNPWPQEFIPQAVFALQTDSSNGIVLQALLKGLEKQQISNPELWNEILELVFLEEISQKTLDLVKAVFAVQDSWSIEVEEDLIQSANSISSEDNRKLVLALLEMPQSLKLSYNQLLVEYLLSSDTDLRLRASEVNLKRLEQTPQLFDSQLMDTTVYLLVDSNEETVINLLSALQLVKNYSIDLWTSLASLLNNYEVNSEVFKKVVEIALSQESVPMQFYRFLESKNFFESEVLQNINRPKSESVRCEDFFSSISPDLNSERPRRRGRVY